MENNELQMADTIHKCIYCESPAYEVEEDKFKCTKKECGLVWRVKNCES